MMARDRGEETLVRRRMELVFLFYLAAVGLLALRLFWVQAVQGRAFQQVANRMQERTTAVDARRGCIRDRNGAELAQDILGKSVAVNPRVVRDKAATAARIAAILGLSRAEQDRMRERMLRAAERRLFYCRLQRGISRTLAETLLARARTDPDLRGVWLEDTPVRVNPSGADGIQLVGTVNTDGHGVEAIELKFDAVLHGRDGKRRFRVDAMGEVIPGSQELLVEPQDGQDVTLTIDRDIQHFTEVELNRMAAEQLPDSATAIVMDIATGDVLAMANYPNFRPGDRVIKPEQRRNRAITDLYEPGSIFKVITAAAALEYGVDTNVYCSGRKAIGNRSVRCAHGAAHGHTDLRRMIEHSCNIAAGTLAERIGPRRMYDFLTRFGFQSKTGIEFPGEEYGLLQKPEKWATMRTVNIGFGQGVVVTPIQMIAAYAAIANDGVYNPPRLVLSAPGASLPERAPRRVMTAANARRLRAHMEAVVASGTGKKAKIAGYSVAGKTGTAQIARNGRYGHGYVASFVGFLPVEHPRLAILVSVWHPRRGQYGGVVAAPVFREIARQCVAFLKIPPDRPDDPTDGAGSAVARVISGTEFHD